MATEADVSVLIPSYRRPDFTRQAVVSALRTGAGEIVVSDDASNDGTVEALADLRDPRLRLIVQPRNLGLWPNHLALLRASTRPWVKFLQNDDHIRPGGLAAMVDAVGPETTLVSARCIYEDKSNGKCWLDGTQTECGTWSSDDYLRRMSYRHNEPGSPSETLWRRDALDLSEDAWRDDLSADLACNVITASRGEVVLLQAGPIVIGVHPGRDGRTQGLEKAFRRHLETTRYLGRSSDHRVRRLAHVLGFAETASSIVSMGNARLRFGETIPRRYPYDLARAFGVCLSLDVVLGVADVGRRIRVRFAPSRVLDASAALQRAKS